ncbi:hypothetical protein PCL_01753 [Purpureocillium lilacinum]|uniref:Uncharacterized protein n=1 Tax=Purpureocillium lilacinum TaxID=33203 RepID=A0A2U3E2G0_PURLI|nr:hypothetical protein PCL_01753 [Purpureocillium lilacinum]
MLVDIKFAYAAAAALASLCSPAFALRTHHGRARAPLLLATWPWVHVLVGHQANWLFLAKPRNATSSFNSA